MRTRKERALLQEVHRCINLSFQACPHEWTAHTIAKDARLSLQTVLNLMQPHKDYAPSSLTLAKLGQATGCSVIVANGKTRFKIHKPRRAG